MSNLVSLSLYEFRKIFQRIYIYFGLCFAVLASAAMVHLNIKAPGTFGLSNVYAVFANVAEYIIIVYGAKALGDDFHFRTVTMVFSNPTSRVKVLLSKLLSVMYLGFILALLSGITSLIAKPILGVEISALSILKDLCELCFVYVLYAFCVGSFTILAAILSKSVLVSVISGAIAFETLKGILRLWAEWKDLLEVVRFIPFYAARDVLMFREYGIPEVIVLLVGGGIFLALAVATLNKKDI